MSMESNPPDLSTIERDAGTAAHQGNAEELAALNRLQTELRSVPTAQLKSVIEQVNANLAKNDEKATAVEDKSGNVFAVHVGPSFEEPNGVHGGRVLITPVENNGGTQKTYEKIRHEYERLNPAVRKEIEKEGFKILAVNELPADPKHPSAIVEGIARVENHTIEMLGTLQNREVGEVVAHEVGHALDFTLGGISEDGTFWQAYKKDVIELSQAMRHMPPAQRERLQNSLDYYLQDDQGSFETFAEVFARSQGYHTQIPPQYFRHCQEVILARLAQLEHGS